MSPLVEDTESDNGHDPPAFPTKKNQARPFTNLYFFAPLLPLAFLWFLLIHGLSAQWSSYEQYNYGWAVPFLCAYLLWRRLRSKERRTRKEFSPLLQVTLLGLVALLYVPTRWLHEANPIWRLTSWLWALEVIVITLLLIPAHFGKAETGQNFTGSTAPATTDCSQSLNCALQFPLFFFLVSVPWPSALETFLTEGLRDLDVSLTTELLSLCGIPAIQHGHIIEIRFGMLGIDEACSGFRSFQATLMLALFFDEFYSLTLLRRGFLVLAGFALSFLFNIGRTFLLVWMASAKGIEVVLSWHDPAGVMILLLCFISLWFLALQLARAKILNPAADDRIPRAAELNAESEHLFPSSKRRGQAWISQPPLFRLRPSIIFSIGLWFVGVEAGTELWYRLHEIPTRAVRISSGSSDWSIAASVEASRIAKAGNTTSQFRADESIEARWEDDAGHAWQVYYFRWLPAHSIRKRVAIQLAKTHGPEKCLPRSGMILEADLGRFLSSNSGHITLALHHYLFSNEFGRINVFYGIYEDPTGPAVLANRRQDTASRIAAALAGSRNYGQRFLELAVWGYDRPAEARAALMTQLTRLVRIRNEDKGS